MDLEAVVRAVDALHSTHSSESQRREADQYLRNWQATFAAWQHSDLLLQATELPPEVHHLAAVTLRSKIMYDFVELPEESHESLCQSLFQNIDKYKFAVPSSVVQFLILALADFSVHAASKWNSPVESIYQRFSHPSLDSSVLVKCLTALPEENVNRRVLVDPLIRAKHEKLLRLKADEVLTRLESMKTQAISSNYSDVFSKILQCYVEWLPLAEDLTSAVQKGSIISDCFNLLHMDTLLSIAKAASTESQPTDTSSITGQKHIMFAHSAGGHDLAMELSNAAVDCLTEVFKICRRSAAAHEGLFQLAVKEFSGPVKDYAMKMVEENDWPICLGLARLYAYLCEGLLNPFATSLHTSAELQKILAVVYCFTEIKFSSLSPELGERGVATFMFPFWSKFIRHISLFFSPKSIDQSTEWDISLSTKSGKNFEAVVQVESLRCISKVLVKLLMALIKSCCFAEDIFDEDYLSKDDLWEFEGFRQQTLSLIVDLRHFFPPPVLFDHVLQSLEEIPKSADSIVALEGHFVVLFNLLRKSQNSIAWKESFQTLVDTVHSYLTPSLPTDYLTACVRLSAVSLLGECALQGWLGKNPQGLHLILESLVGQMILFTSNSYEEYSKLTANVKMNEVEMLEEFHTGLLSASAKTVCCVCRHNADNAHLQSVLSSLIDALHNRFASLPEEAYADIVESVTVVISQMEGDSEYLQAVENLCNPIVAAIVQSTSLPSTVSSAGQTCTPLLENGNLKEHQKIHVKCGGLASTCQGARWVNRLALVMKCLIPIKKDQRQKAIGVFTVNCVWPMMSELMRKYQNCKVLIEKCDRVLKHSMRCSPECFGSLLQPFSALIIGNARLQLFSTYLYAAEWLAGQYFKCLDQRPTLSELYTELSSLSIAAIDTMYSDGTSADGFELLEDFYTMTSRYLRNSPLVACSSQNVIKVLDLSRKVIYHEHDDVSVAVFGFLETIVSVAAGKGISRDMTEQDVEGFEKIRNLFLAPLLLEHLPLLLSELIRLLSTVPRSNVFERVCNLMDCIVVEWPKPQLAKSIDAALLTLPPKIISSEGMRLRLVNQITYADGSSLDDALEEIHYRCKQMYLRSRPTTASNQSPKEQLCSDSNPLNNCQNDTSCPTAEIPHMHVNVNCNGVPFSASTSHTTSSTTTDSTSPPVDSTINKPQD